MTVLRYIDVVLVLAAAPIMLLIGVPAVGYGVGVGTWILVRAVGVALERYAAATRDATREMTLRIVYLISRIFVLAMAVVLVRRGEGKNDALAALAVIVFAFTINLGLSFANRPQSR
jgi:hypothetical protein